MVRSKAGIENPENIQTAHTVQDTTGAQFEEQPARSSLMFDPYLTSSHPFVVAVADNLAFAFEHLMGTRKRKMKARDKANLHAMLIAILANLARAVAEGVDPPSVGVSLRVARRRVSRYDRPAFTGLPNLLETITQTRLGISLTISRKKGIASTITADSALKDSIARFNFRPEYFAQAEGREAVWLTLATHDYVEKTTERLLIDYTDTPETERYRAEMKTINEALKAADIRMVRDGGPEVLTSIRELRRNFNLLADSPEGTERFDLGGRLFGGFWQNLPKSRRHLIRINGEPIADLDFSSMFLRLAYLEAGLAPPEGDLYAAVQQGFSGSQWREGVKKVTNAMLFRATPLTRLPKDVKDILPPATSGTQIRDAILAAHPDLKTVFETGIGLRLMFLESQILVAALLRLASQGIVALPMHDGLMCQRSKADRVKQAMGEAAKRIVGFRLPIALKSQRE